MLIFKITVEIILKNKIKEKVDIFEEKKSKNIFKNSKRYFISPTVFHAFMLFIFLFIILFTRFTPYIDK